MPALLLALLIFRSTIASPALPLALVNLASLELFEVVCSHDACRLHTYNHQLQQKGKRQDSLRRSTHMLSMLRLA